MESNDESGFDLLVHPNYKEGSLAGQNPPIRWRCSPRLSSPSKDGTELLLHDVDHFELREDSQLSSVLIVSN